MNWPLNPLPLLHTGSVPNMIYMYSSGNFMQFLEKKRFVVNWPPHHTHEDTDLVTMDFL